MSKHLKLRLKKLESMPTLHTGQFDDLKVETKDTRIWLSRMTVEDGMEYNNQVTIEKYQLPPTFTKNGLNKGIDPTKPKIWVTVDQYKPI